MTLAPALIAARPFLAPAVAVVLGVLVVGNCNARKRAEAALNAERARASEGATLTAQGQEVVASASDAELRRQVVALRASNADFRTALDGAWRAAKGAKPVAVGHASTGPVVVQAPPATVKPSSVPTPATPLCLLHPGDQGEVRVDSLVLQTQAGNRVLVGAASAWVGDLRLFGGPFSATLTEAAAEAPPAPSVPRWGAGPWLGLGSGGVAYGVALAAPPRRFLGLSLELAAAGGVTKTGQAQGSAWLVVRP